MSRVRSLVLVALLLAFLLFPILGLLLWAAVFLWGYTPPLWLAVVVFVGMVLNFLVLVGRRVHPSYRPR